IGRAAGPADAASHARSAGPATDSSDQCLAGAYGGTRYSPLAVHETHGRNLILPSVVLFSRCRQLRQTQTPRLPRQSKCICCGAFHPPVRAENQILAASTTILSIRYTGSGALRALSSKRIASKSLPTQDRGKCRLGLRAAGRRAARPRRVSWCSKAST